MITSTQNQIPCIIQSLFRHSVGKGGTLQKCSCSDRNNILCTKATNKENPVLRVRPTHFFSNFREFFFPFFFSLLQSCKNQPLCCKVYKNLAETFWTENVFCKIFLQKTSDFLEIFVFFGGGSHFCRQKEKKCSDQPTLPGRSVWPVKRFLFFRGPIYTTLCSLLLHNLPANCEAI